LSCIRHLSHVPKETSDNAFYLRALPKPKGEIWYYKKAMGWETLGNAVKKIMKKAGFEGHYTNHSLRCSSATRLYDAGIPEKVIQEMTGHRSSDGVKAYKCTSSSLKRKASEILQGTLPMPNPDVKPQTAINVEGKRAEFDAHERAIPDSTQRIVISTSKTKIFIAYK
jgi:hypothetical protein